MRSVKITSEGPTFVGASIVSDDGAEVKYCRKATIILDPERANTAHLELVGAVVEVEAKPKSMLKHPVTGEIVGVTRIEFDDGSSFPDYPEE